MDILPPEVLCVIFHWYLESSNPLYAPIEPTSRTASYSIHNIDSARYTIQRVCRLWRAVSISDPRLWTMISLYPPSCMTVFCTASADARQREKDAYWRILHARLARASDLPLTVVFTFFEWHIACIEDSMRISETFLSLLPRCSDLALEVEFRDVWDDGTRSGRASPYAERFDNGHPQSLARLRTLRTGYGVWEKEFLCRVPGLRVLALNAPHESHGPIYGVEAIQTAELITLSLRHIVLPSLLIFLQHVPNVESLTLLDIVEPYEYEHTPPAASHQRLTLPHLRSLTICGACIESSDHSHGYASPTYLRPPWNPVDVLLSHMSLPSLQHLHITAHRCTVDSDAPELGTWPGQGSIDFFARGECELETLTVTAREVNGPGMEDVLSNQRRTLKTVSVHLDGTLSQSVRALVAEFLP